MFNPTGSKMDTPSVGLAARPVRCRSGNSANSWQTYGVLRVRTSAPAHHRQQDTSTKRAMNVATVRSFLSPFAGAVLLSSTSIGQTTTLYAADVVAPAGWIRVDEAIGDPGDFRCDGLPPREWAANNTGGAEGINAFLFDNLNLPACEEVTAIYVDVLARFTTDDGGIRLQVSTDSGLQLGSDFRSCFSSGGNGNCRWRFNSSSSPQGVNIFPFFQAAGLSPADIRRIRVSCG